MRSRPRILGALFGALLLTAAVPAAFAQPRPGGGERRGTQHGPGGRDGARALFEFLDLTEEQRQAWGEAHRAHFEALRPTFEKIRDVREQLRAELESDSPDAATVGGYVISIHQLDNDIKASGGDLEAAIAEILTDEQETKLEAWKASHPERRHGPGGGPGGSHGDGPRGDGPRRGGPGFGGPGGGPGGDGPGSGADG